MSALIRLQIVSRENQLTDSGGCPLPENGTLDSCRDDSPRLGKGPCLLIALLYGGMLAALPLLAFRDRTNYLAYASDSLLVLARNVVAGPSAVIVNEPVWLLLNAALGLAFSPEFVVRLIIFVSASLTSYMLIRKGLTDGRAWLLLFLFMPQLIENYTTHLTQGCAIAIFLAGWFSASRFRKWLLLGLSPLMHSSFFVILALCGLTEITKRLRLAEDVRATMTVLMGCFMSIGLLWFASILGARQSSEYEYGAAASVSGIGFAFWLIVLALIFFEGYEFTRRHGLATAALLFYLTTYFFLQFTGRIFESAIALVILAGLQLTSWRRFVFLSASCAWIGVGWLMQLATSQTG